MNTLHYMNPTPISASVGPFVETFLNIGGGSRSLLVELFFVESIKGFCEKICVGDVGFSISFAGERMFIGSTREFDDERTDLFVREILSRVSANSMIASTSETTLGCMRYCKQQLYSDKP